MTDLRARIAAAIPWVPSDLAHMIADAVIRELRLRPLQTYDPIHDRTSTCYVTDTITTHDGWKADDE